MPDSRKQTITLSQAKSFVNTHNHPSYDNSWEIVEDDHRFTEFHAEHSDLGSTAVSHGLEMPRERVREWINGSRPDCVQGLEVAEAKGWINVDPDTESNRLRGLNCLLAWIFSGDSVRTRNFAPYWVIDEEHDRHLLHRAADVVDIDLHETRGKSDGRPSEVRPVEHGSVLGRVLAVMGAPTGEKSEWSDIRLPDYLENVPDRSSQEFIQVYLHNRGHVHDSSDLISFREQRTDAYLRSMARFIRRLTTESVTVSGQNIYISAAGAREMTTWETVLAS